MARKRRAPSPDPPQQSSFKKFRSYEEEEPRAPTSQKPQHAAANNADDYEGSDSDSDTDAHDFQLRQVHRVPTKLPHPQSASDADDDEEGGSSSSEPENPEPVVPKKTLAMRAAGKSKVEQERTRPALDPEPTGKAKKSKAGTEKAAAVSDGSPPSKVKKGKAELEKPAPGLTPAVKAKKVKAEPVKAVRDATPSGKGKKAGTKTEKLNTSPADSKSDKPARAPRVWGKGDEMIILEALAAHVKSKGVRPKTEILLNTVRDRLERKNCTYTDMYEKVRRLKERYDKAMSKGIVPSKDDELEMYNLLATIWGEKEKGDVAAAMSQKDGAVTKSNKGHASKRKNDENSVDGAAKEAATSTATQNGDPWKRSKKVQAIKEKTDRDVKSRLSMEATTTATPSRTKKRENHNEELNKDAKDGTLKDDTTIGTQNDTDLIKSNREKSDKGKMNRDTDSRMPKEPTTTNQNGGTQIKSMEVGSHDEEIERDANVHGMRRGFDKLQELYSNLALYVEEIEAHHPCGETLKRSFEFIGDDKAEYLESKIKKYRVAELKAHNRRADIQKEVLNVLLSFMA